MSYTKLFTSFALSEAEHNANAWLSENPVQVESVTFAPLSSGKKQNEMFIMLFCSDQAQPTTTRLKLFDSGIDSPTELGVQIDDWLKRTGAVVTRVHQFARPSNTVNPNCRLYLLVEYQPA